MHHHGHSHNHNHGVECAQPGQREQNRKGLLISLSVTFGIMLLEFFGGLLTNSLALLSDSGHMLSDTGSLALSLGAMYFAVKPPSEHKSYGFYRLEILAALFNGLTLVLIAGFVIWEAYGRFLLPPAVHSESMMLIAAIGLGANLISAWALMHGDVHGNTNMRSAYLHVIGDAVGSVGAIIAGLLMYFFSWYIADPIISVLVAILILRSAWGLIDQTVHILMEGTPTALDFCQIRDAITELPGVISVHDLHIWTITSGMDAFSCHLVINFTADNQQVLQAAIALLAERFAINHVTIQIETPDLKHMELNY